VNYETLHFGPTPCGDAHHGSHLQQRTGTSAKPASAWNILNNTRRNCSFSIESCARRYHADAELGD
jgi:hypothetical protein